MTSALALEAIWARRPKESAADYGAFLEWLHIGPERGGPPTQHSQAAARWDWAPRALAYERAQGTDGPPELSVARNAMALAEMEIRKMLLEHAQNPGSGLTVKDCAQLVALSCQIVATKVKAEGAVARKLDPSKLTTEQIKLLLEADRIRREAGGEQ